MKQKEYTPLLRGSSEKSKTREPEQEAQTSGKQPMMYVDVFVEQDGEQVKQRIPVYEDDQAETLAEQFCRIHGYDQDTQLNL